MSGWSWLIALALLLRCGSSYASGFDPARMREDTSVPLVPSSYATTGAAAVDFDGVPPQELLVGSASSWLVLGVGPGGKLDVVRLRRGFGTATCRLLRAGDVDGDGRDDVVALVSPASASPDVDLVAYDLRTGAEKGRQRLFSSSQVPRDLLVANVEGGPEGEVFAINRDDLWMARLGEPTLWSFPGAGGTSLAIGNVDLDPEPEVVVAAGHGVTATILEPTLRRGEWIYTPGFGTFVTVADVDADGVAEIFGTANGRMTRVDGLTRTERWSSTVYVADGPRALAVDLDQDGDVELVVPRTTLYRFDAATGAVLTQVCCSSVGSAGAIRLDLAGCQRTVVWPDGYSSLFGWRPGLSSFASLGPPVLEPTSAVKLAVGRLRGDGRTKLLWSSEGGSSGTLGVADLHQDLEEERKHTSLRGPLAIQQVDADPALEYAVPDPSGDGSVRVLDGESGTLEWATASLFLKVGAVVFDDVDGGGDAELLVGTASFSSSFIRLYRAATGVLLWKSPDLMGTLRDVAIGQVDASAGTEILAAVGSVGIYAFDGTTHLETWRLPQTKASAVAIGNVNGDATQDLVVGTSTGSLEAYDGPTRAPLLQASVSGQAINAVRVVDVDGDGSPELVVAYGSASLDGGVAVVRPGDLTVLWRSEALLGDAGSGGSLFVGDADDDGRTEIVVGTRSGVFTYEYESTGADSLPPVWEGSPALAATNDVDCCPRVNLTWGLARDAESPPVRYRVHRGAPGFVPSPDSLVAETSGGAYSDRDAPALTQVEYLVRAVDRLGNEDDNEARVSVVSPPALTLEVRPLDPALCPADIAYLRPVASLGTPTNIRWYENGNYSFTWEYFSTQTPGTYHCVADVGSCRDVVSRPTVVTVVRNAGDVSGDCVVSLRDAFALGAHFFGGLGVPYPIQDIDGSGILDVKDLDYLVDRVLATPTTSPLAAPSVKVRP